MQPDVPATPRKRSPVLVGCLVVAGLILLLVILMLAGVLVARQKVLSYTDDHPVTLPQYVPPKEEQESALRKFEILRQAVEKGNAARVELTAGEINTLIAQSGKAGLNGKAFIHIEGDRISADAAVPLDSLPGFTGRWLNGTITLDARLENGQLVVRPVRVVVRGKELPANIMKKLRSKNLADRAYADPNARRLLERLEEFAVRDGRLVIALRAAKR